MKQINTYPIEQFLDKARIAIKSNQRNLVLDIKEIQALSEALGLVMTRLSGYIELELQSVKNEPPVVTMSMDGGSF